MQKTISLTSRFSRFAMFACMLHFPVAANAVGSRSCAKVNFITRNIDAPDVAADLLTTIGQYLKRLPKGRERLFLQHEKKTAVLMIEDHTSEARFIGQESIQEAIDRARVTANGEVVPLHQSPHLTMTRAACVAACTISIVATQAFLPTTALLAWSGLHPNFFSPGAMELIASTFAGSIFLTISKPFFDDFRNELALRARSPFDDGQVINDFENAINARIPDSNNPVSLVIVTTRRLNDTHRLHEYFDANGYEIVPSDKDLIQIARDFELKNR